MSTVPSFKEVMRYIVNDYAKTSTLPLWIESKDGTEFNSLLKFFLGDFKRIVGDKKKSMVEALIQLRKKYEELKDKIQIIKEYTPEKMHSSLKDDVTFNKTLLKNVIQERHDYTQFLAGVINKSKEEVSGTLLTEVCDFIKETFPTYLKIHTEAYKRFKSQYNSLINVDGLSPKEVREKIDSKVILLKKDLELTEQEIENTKHSLSLLSQKLEEIETTEKKLQ